MNDKKITISVLIEGDRIFSETYNSNQKIQVIVQKALANLKVEEGGRILRKEDGTPIDDFSKSIEEIGIQNREVLRFVKSADKPDRDKGFAQ